MSKKLLPLSLATVTALCACNRAPSIGDENHSLREEARKRGEAKRGFVGAARTRAPQPAPTLAELSPAELDQRRKLQNVFVFDNNTKERWAKGHVPGAIWVDPSELTAASLPADKDATLVFYCANWL